MKQNTRRSCESAGKPDALQTLREFVRLACFVAKRLECVRLAGAFALLFRVPSSVDRPHATRNTLSAHHVSRAFTLIEIMVVVAIMAIVMTLAIPMIYQQLHPESMRKAVSEVMEACSHARARAILDGVQVDLVIHPADRQFDLSVGSSAPPPPIPGATELFSPDVAGNDWRAAPRPSPSSGSSGEGFFPVKLSNKILIEGMGINGEDYTEDEEGRVRFYPNGTSDEFSIVLLSTTGERRNITLEVVTALADVESDPNKFKAR